MALNSDPNKDPGRRRGRLEQPLRHQVGIAPIGRGGMRVVIFGQSKVAFVFGSGRFHDIFAGAEQFYHRE